MTTMAITASSRKRSLGAVAEEYFRMMNPLASRIGEDIRATKEAYEGLWKTLSSEEKEQAINETIIQPEVALKYTLRRKNDPGGGVKEKDREREKERDNLPEVYPKLRFQTGMKYVIDETGNTLRWKDEHSGPFSFMTQSQMNLSFVTDSADGPTSATKSKDATEPPQGVPTTAAKADDVTGTTGTFDSPPSNGTSCYQSDFYESFECSDALDGRRDASDSSDNIFGKLIGKASRLKIAAADDDDDDDLERLVPRNQRSVATSIPRTRSSDVTESTALLDTPSSYSSFQSSQLNAEEAIPKTGFEFLDNW